MEPDSLEPTEEGKPTAKSCSLTSTRGPWTALHYACAHGQSEMVALLLWYDCNIEARDRDESTALIKATQRQHEECVKILLENGADPNAIDAYQNAALHYTVYNNTVSIAARLLAFNADTEVKTKHGYTPLILAVLENKQEMVELLLQSDANINALDNYKRSALIHAMRAQSKDMISLLLQQGADASLMDVYGATARSHAVFETFQVLSKDASSNHLEPTTGKDRNNFDVKQDDCTPCTYPTQDNEEKMVQLPAKEEENIDTVAKLGSQVALEHQEKELEICEDCSPKAETCPECYPKTSLDHKIINPKPTTEEDEHSISSKTPGVQAPMLTESSLWIGYPADWPEPVKFSRQPAVYNPAEWREDMESRSVLLEENQHPAAVLSGKEANTQTHRVSKGPGANDCDPTEKENAEDELVSLLAPLKENKPQMKEFSVTEAAKLQTDVKLDGQGVLEYEENGLETCQESNLEASESTESYSILRFSTKPDLSDTEPTARKDEYNFDTKSVSENLPNKCEEIASNAIDPKGKYIENKHTGESDSEVTMQSEQKSLDDSENTQLQVEEMSKKWPSLELEVSENLCLMATDYNASGLTVKRKGGRTKKLFPAEEKDKLAKLTKRQATEKHKMETQVNEMEEANSQSQPSATASDNDSGSLLKLWDKVHSYERQMELKNSHYELLTRKPENMENMASGIQREQTEIKKIKSWLQHKGADWEELCTLRFPLKQGEKQENAESTSQQKKMQPSRKEEPCDENEEWTQHPETRMVITDIKAIETGLRQLQGPQDQLSQTVQSSEKTKAILQRLEVRLSKLKITLKEQSAKIEQIQNQLLHEGLLGDGMEELIQQAQSLECTLEKQMDKNEDLMIELAGYTS